MKRYTTFNNYGKVYGVAVLTPEGEVVANIPNHVCVGTPIAAWQIAEVVCAMYNHVDFYEVVKRLMRYVHRDEVVE